MSSRAGKPVRHFECGGPTVKGEAYGLLQHGGGFRIEQGKHWYIYNDTLDRELAHTVVFAPDTILHVPKHSRTVYTRQRPSSGHRSGAIECSTVVYPLETLEFVSFSSKKAMQRCGYRSSSSLRTLSDYYVATVQAAMKERLTAERHGVDFLARQKTRTDEEILYACRRSKLAYYDLSFPPSLESLQRPQDTDRITDAELMVWGRPRSYLPPCVYHRIGVLRGRPSPDSIRQGQLGDCWLLSAIAVVADSKTMIHDLFQHPVGSASKRRKERKVGGYRVYLNKGGWWRNVIVDDYLPTLRTVRAFATTATNPCDLWVSLLEKAYAKVHGSYANITGGNPLHALRDLTGFPVYDFEEVWGRAAVDDDAATAFFKDLLRYRKKGYVVCLSTPSRLQLRLMQVTSGDAAVGLRHDWRPQLADTDYAAAGLNCGHAYAVLSVRQFHLPTIRLLRIRNPWGSTEKEWSGRWSRTSELWRRHPLVRRACRPSEKPDGTFWMEWKDVVRYFDGGGTCMVKKHWFDYRLPCTFDGECPSLVLCIVVKHKQRLFLSLSQQDRRLQPTAAAEDVKLNGDAPSRSVMYKSIHLTVSRAVTSASSVPQEQDTKDNESTTPTPLGLQPPSVMNAAKQELMALSTRNPDLHPVGTFVFTCVRDVDMQLELDPASNPHYVIPRIMVPEHDSTRPFTLGLMTPTKPSASGLSVSFVQLPADCAVFRNASTFSVHGERAVETKFQYRKRGRMPRLKGGTSMHNAVYVKESYPFPY